MLNRNIRKEILDRVIPIIFVMLIFAPHFLMSKTDTQMDIYSSMSVICSVFASILLGRMIEKEKQDKSY